MRILLVEDDRVLADALSRALVRVRPCRGRRLHTARRPTTPWRWAPTTWPSWTSACRASSGLEVLQRLRARAVTTPVLMLTALRYPRRTACAAWTWRADDYLAKPFDLPRAGSARARAAAPRHASPRPFCEHGSAALRHRGPPRVPRQAAVGRCRRASWPCWNCCCCAPGACREQGAHASTTSTAGATRSGDNAIEVNVYRLRKKLEPLGCEIRTVRGMGYLIDSGADAGDLSPGCSASCWRWLLGPLAVLLVLDTRWSTGPRCASPTCAYDRALHEIATRDRAARASSTATRPRLELSRPPPTSCCSTRRTSSSTAWSAEDGADLGGDAAAAAAPRRTKAAKPDFYGGAVRERAGAHDGGLVARWADAGPPLRAGAGGRDAQQAAALHLGDGRQRGAAAAAADRRWRRRWSWFGVVARAASRCSGCARAVSDRSHLDLSPIDTHDVPGEVRPLVDEVNELMARLGAPSTSRTASWPTRRTS